MGQNLTSKESEARGAILFYQGQCLRAQHKLDEALQLYQESRRIFDLCGLQHTMQYHNALVGIGLTLSKLRRPQESLEVFREVGEVYLKIKDGDFSAECRVDFANGLKSWGITCMYEHAFDEALDKFTTARGIFEESQHTQNVRCNML